MHFSVLQGTFTDSKCDVLAALDSLLLPLVDHYLAPESPEKVLLLKKWSEEGKPTAPSCHVTNSIIALKRAVVGYSSALPAADGLKSRFFREQIGGVCLEGGWGVCATSCVVGGVLGAMGGYDSLPRDWLRCFGANNKRYLNNKVNLLLDMFGLP